MPNNISEVLTRKLKWKIGINNNLELLKAYDVSIVNNLDIQNNFRFDISKVTIDNTTFKSNIDASFLKQVDISNLTVNNNLIVNNESTFKNQVDICNSLLVTEDASFNNNVTIRGDLTVDTSYVRYNIQTYTHSDPIFMIDPTGIPDIYDSSMRGIGFKYGVNDNSFGFFGYDSQYNGFRFDLNLNDLSHNNISESPQTDNILYGKVAKVDVSINNTISGKILFNNSGTLFYDPSFIISGQDVLLNKIISPTTNSKHIVNKDYVLRYSKSIYSTSSKQLTTAVQDTSGELNFNHISGYKVYIEKKGSAIADPSSINIKLTFSIGILMSWEFDQYINLYILRDHSTNDINNKELSINAHQLTKKVKNGNDISICDLNIGSGNAAGPFFTVWNFEYFDDLKKDHDNIINLNENNILYRLHAELVPNTSTFEISSGIIGYDGFEFTYDYQGTKTITYRNENLINAEIIYVNQ